MLKNRYPAVPTETPYCGQCSGGLRDSGGIHPWGEYAMVLCDCMDESASFTFPGTPRQAFLQAGWKTRKDFLAS